jgi:OPA family glycerol-3-phosphate transporter-like MFS transporter
LIGWTLIDGLIIKDSPKDAGFSDLDTADASSDEPEQDLSSYVLLKKVFTSPVMLTIALVDCCSGIVRNGIMQWYFVFAREVAQPGAEFFLTNWGLLLCFAGIAGSFAAGGISDRLFQSRRGPPALIFFGCMFVLTVLMAVFLFSSPFIVGLCAVLMTFFVIGVHGMMSGTAAADFGGKKATATCSGIVDGFVYLGSGLQSISLGYLTGMSWHYWPLFLMPFTLLGMYFGWKLWYSLPAATQRYIREVEGSKA